MKILFVTSSPYALENFLLPHILRLSKRYDVHVCVNLTLYPLSPEIKKIVTIHNVPIQRKISIKRDIQCLLLLLWIMLRLRPKGGT